MPNYKWLISQKLDTSSLPARIGALRKVGVPYPPGTESRALADLKSQAAKIVTSLDTGLVKASPDTEIIALIAYLQRLGTDIKGQTPSPPPAQTAAPSRPTAQLDLPKQTHN